MKDFFVFVCSYALLAFIATLIIKHFNVTDIWMVFTAGAVTAMVAAMITDWIAGS